MLRNGWPFCRHCGTQAHSKVMSCFLKLISLSSWTFTSRISLWRKKGEIKISPTFMFWVVPPFQTQLGKIYIYNFLIIIISRRNTSCGEMYLTSLVGDVSNSWEDNLLSIHWNLFLILLCDLWNSFRRSWFLQL